MAKMAGKQTGPTTAAGKQRSSRNALKYGLRSTDFLLAEESEADFLGLLSELMADLRPVGVYEKHLLERIAVGIWRNRRLLRAERAEIELAQQVDAVKKRLLVDFGYHAKISEEQIANIDPEMTKARSILVSYTEECDRLEKLSAWPTLATIKDTFPCVFQWLVLESMDAKQPLELYCRVDAQGVPQAMPTRLREIRDFIKRYREVTDRKLSDNLAIDVARVGQLVPARADLFARYQTALDNQVERAFRQLAQAQALRGRTIEMESAMLGRPG
jgi:hypothetical protein